MELRKSSFESLVRPSPPPRALLLHSNRRAPGGDITTGPWAAEGHGVGRQRLSVRVARKKSRSNSAVLDRTQDKMTFTEDETTLWVGAQITANKIKLHMSSLQLDEDLQKGKESCRQVIDLSVFRNFLCARRLHVEDFTFKRQDRLGFTVTT